MGPKERKYKIAVTVILILGVLIRIIGIGGLPAAANVDEVSSGYEAFSIANYGIDRNGNFIPAFLVAWGGGQNALLTYLIIPFIKIMGNTLWSIRLPMALIGCISLYVVNSLLDRIGNKKIALIRFNIFCNMSLAYNEKQMGIRV